ncbi:GtrA family protein [archaeon]|jgi:putative flippase GtrA|nr:GtrA family protein [archaeon]MBT3577703.1 GtrA family protein [archaeon]MBT6820030.1 GtrA family protein [archaeon]MBT7025369.1 GtrA family protein [archaeon]MBT7238443.1 GtrA family protein [archaeon]
MKGYWKFVTFCIIGGVSALIDLAFFNLAFFIGTGFVLSRIFGVLISMIFNFTMNRNVSFSARGRSVRGQIPKYLIVYLISSTVNVVGGFVAVTLLGSGTIQANIASVIGIAAAIPFSYFGLLLWAFKKN